MVRLCVTVFGAALAASSLALAGPAGAGVTIAYYSGFTDTGAGVTVDPATQLTTGTAPSIQLGDLQPNAAINTAANWQGPDALFGAIINEEINSPNGGTYDVSLVSDDASYLFVNGVKALSNGGAHAENTVSGMITLAAGLNTIQVQYDNSICCHAGVQLSGLPASASDPGAVPEPAGWALMLLGLFGLGAGLRARRGEHLDRAAAA